MSQETILKRLSDLNSVADIQNFYESGEYLQYHVSKLDAFYLTAKRLEEISQKPVDPLKLAHVVAELEDKKAKAFNKAVKDNADGAIAYLADDEI